MKKQDYPTIDEVLFVIDQSEWYRMHNYAVLSSKLRRAETEKERVEIVTHHEREIRAYDKIKDRATRLRDRMYWESIGKIDSVMVKDEEE